MVQRPKVTITLDEEIFNSLKKEADEQERTPANLAAYIVTKAIKDNVIASSSQTPKAS